MKTILTYGTFDLLHVGHIRLLSRLKRLGDRLVVGLSTDAFNAVKGKQSIFSYAERYEILSSLSMVNIVIPEESWEQKRSDIIEYAIDVFAIGDDWAGKFDHLRDLTDVVYIPRTENISTTGIREFIGKIEEEKLFALTNSLEASLEMVRQLRSNDADSVILPQKSQRLTGVSQAIVRDRKRGPAKQWVSRGTSG